MNENIFKSRSKGVHLVPGVDTTCYTCPVNYTTHIRSIFVANLGVGNKTVSIGWYNNNTNDSFYLVGGYVINAYGYLAIDNSYFTINAGDYIFMQSEANSTMDATVTVEEYFDPTSRQ